MSDKLSFSTTQSRPAKNRAPSWEPPRSGAALRNQQNRWRSSGLNGLNGMARESLSGTAATGRPS